ncbi:MAG: DUF368 domain-containing protein [Planctomycetota bacterium]|jgi:putative membrane protein
MNPKPPRLIITGLLMGLANLVPGVSGGTMVVVMGLYDEFVSAIADITRLTFARRNIVFLTILTASAMVAIGGFSGILSKAVTLHRSAMFSLFIGMTLGGIPMLWKMRQNSGRSWLPGGIVGLTIMTLIALNQADRPPSESIKQAIAEGTLVIEADYTRDLLAGALGMSAMVLPGISGAYMLLIIGRYETILAAISLCKEYVLSMGSEGDWATFTSVLLPVAIGALASLVLLSNLLKWLMHRHTGFTIGLLLGILCGSVIGIWPFDAKSTTAGIVTGILLAGAGFITTLLLGKIGNNQTESPTA